MSTFDLGTWHVFDPSHQKADKWQALKVLEEAAEVVEAAKEYIEAAALQVDQVASTRLALTDEIADLLQTITNMCDAYEISTDMLKYAQTHCTKKNKLRGMFDEGPRTHMHREEDKND